MKKTILCAALSAITSSSYALELLDDAILSETTGADGIAIDARATSIAMDRLYWEDNTGADARQLRLNTVNVRRDVAGSADLAAALQMNTGSTNVINGTPALNLSLVTSPTFLTAGSLEVCNNASVCGTTMGRLAIQMPNQSSLSLSTSNGFLSKSGNAKVGIVLDGMNIYLTQQENATVSNQFIMADIRANIDANGKIWVDTVEGLRFQGTATLNKVVTTDGNGVDYNGRAGLQFSLMHRGNVGSGASTTYNITSAGGFAQFGASGRFTNINVGIRGTDDTTTNIFNRVDNNPANSSIIGNRGIAFSLTGEFDRTANGTANSASFQVGEAGNGGYGLRFQDNRSFVNVNSTTQNGTLSFGNMYVNLIKTNYIALPDVVLNANNKITRTAGVAVQLGTTANYGLNLTAPDGVTALNADSIGLMIRGMEFQEVPQKTIFIANNGAPVPANAASAWSLLPIVYNLNGNVVLYGARQGDQDRIGFGFQVSTQGLSADKTKSTTIALVNTGACDNTTGASTAGTRATNCNQYIGFRNIDLLAKGNGVLTTLSNKVRLDMTNLLILADTEFAVGYLPGALRGDGSVAGTIDNPNDALFGLRLRLDASTAYVEFAPAGNTAATNFIGINAELNLNNNQNSAVFIVEPVDNTTVGLQSMTGRLRLSNGKIDFLSDSVEFSGTLEINPNNVASEDFRIRDVNFYPGGTTTPQRLGEIAMSGGQIYSRIKLTPK
jgi:hypothetical protein